MRIADKLRAAGIATDMDLASRGVTKNMDYADKMKIPHVLLVGVMELKRNKFKLRNMKNGTEQYLDIEEIIKKLKEKN